MHAVPVTGLLRFRTTFPMSKLGLRAHFGPSILVYTKERSDGDDMNVALKYGLIGTYTEKKLLVQLGFSGYYNASADGGDFGSNSLHQLGMSVNFDAGARVWPGIILRIPLDEDLTKILDLVLGLNMMLRL